MSAFGHIFVAPRGGLRICLASSRAGWVPAENFITSPKQQLYKVEIFRHTKALNWLACIRFCLYGTGAGGWARISSSISNHKAGGLSHKKKFIVKVHMAYSRKKEGRNQYRGFFSPWLSKNSTSSLPLSYCFIFSHVDRMCLFPFSHNLAIEGSPWNAA